MPPGSTRYPRIVERVLRDELLPDFPAVLLVGPRGCGKSTSAAQLADATVDLSRPGVARAAREDPDSVLRAVSGCLVIDEWQEAPKIVGAVKRAVDAGIGTDRYLLTGSVRAARHQLLGSFGVHRGVTAIGIGADGQALLAGVSIHR